MYTLLPSHTHEIPSPADLPCVMRKGKFGAMRMAPRKHRYLAKPGVMEDYMEVAVAHRIPVVFDTAHGLTLEEVYDFMERFPQLTAILSYFDMWPAERYERPLIARFPNLKFDLSGMIIDQGLEGLVAEYGHHRFLFGSRFPSMYIGGMMMQIKRSMLPKRDIEDIAGSNLFAIIKGAAL
jgi:predicted TIM-barrel fold metal-dependent hydrolase